MGERGNPSNTDHILVAVAAKRTSPYTRHMIVKLEDPRVYRRLWAASIPVPRDTQKLCGKAKIPSITLFQKVPTKADAIAGKIQTPLRLGWGNIAKFWGKKVSGTKGNP